MDRNDRIVMPEALAPLQSLRELARSAAEDPLDGALEAVSEALHQSAGFGEVAVSLYRPDWDDFCGVIVKGSQAAQDALIGGVTPRATLSDFGRYGEEVAPGVFFVDGSSELWLITPTLHTPNRAEYDHPDAWRTDDGLIVTLDDVDGEPLGLVSLDEPYTERRLTTAHLQLVEVICSYASQALRNARRSRRLERQRTTLTRIAEVSPKFSSCDSRRELYGLLSSAVAPGLGFDRAAVYVAGPTSMLTRAAHSGSAPGARDVSMTVEPAAIDEALSPDRELAGCWLLPAIAVFDTPRPHSPRNGYGPRAWSDHCLAIPWRHQTDELAGIILVEDPVDRLLPEQDQLRALRLLVDLTAAIERALDPVDQLTA